MAWINFCECNFSRFLCDFCSSFHLLLLLLHLDLNLYMLNVSFFYLCFIVESEHEPCTKEIREEKEEISWQKSIIIKISAYCKQTKTVKNQRKNEREAVAADDDAFVKFPF